MSYPSLRLPIFPHPSTLPFVAPQAEMIDGWYIWRLNKDWPEHEYRCVEVANGIMVDREPVDGDGAEWRIIEVALHGEFYGPVILR